MYCKSNSVSDLVGWLIEEFQQALITITSYVRCQPSAVEEVTGFQWTMGSAHLLQTQYIAAQSLHVYGLF